MVVHIYPYFSYFPLMQNQASSLVDNREFHKPRRQEGRCTFGLGITAFGVKLRTHKADDEGRSPHPASAGCGRGGSQSVVHAIGR